MNAITRFAVFVLTGYLLNAGLVLADDNALAQRLKQIDMQRNGSMTDTRRLESECLKLLNENSSPEDRGKVYVEIALVYAQSGLTEPEKVIKYCKKALEHPLRITDAVQMYVFLADALQVKNRNLSGSELAAGRREITTVCLRGLKLILEQDVRAERQELPVVHRFDCGGPTDSPEYQELLKRNEEQMRARERVMVQNTLIMHREALVDKITALYSGPSPHRGELLMLGREILGNEEAIRNLVARVEQKTVGKPPGKGKNDDGS